MINKNIAIWLCAIMIGSAAGCKASNQPVEPSPSSTLSEIQGDLTVWVEEDVRGVFESYAEGPLRNRHPKLSLSVQSFLNEESADLASLAAVMKREKQPDLIFASSWSLPKLARYGLLEKIVLQGNQLPTIEPTLLDGVRAVEGTTGLMALPFSIDYPALFYNKSIFDELKVPYPSTTRGITWDEVLELAKKLAGGTEGDHYYPLNAIGAVSLVAGQLSLPYLDPATDQSLVEDGTHKPVTGAKWKQLNDLYAGIGKIDGNDLACTNHSDNNLSFGQGSVAMAVRSMNRGGGGYGMTGDANFLKMPLPWWDVVQFPTFTPGGEGPAPEFTVLAVPPESGNKTLAADVIRVLVSRDVQLENAQNGMGTVLLDESVKSQFGASANALTGKNIASLPKTKWTPQPKMSKYLDYGVRNATTRFYTQLLPCPSAQEGPVDIDKFVAGQRANDRNRGLLAAG